MTFSAKAFGLVKMGGGSKAVPDRWLDYTRIGKPIPGTRVVCFKVPLKKEICQSLPLDQRFTPDMLMESLPDLVGVIDVTNTPRYYNNQELIQRGIKHEKIQCPGHVVPPHNVVQTFKGAMDNLWKLADSLGKYVGVHCTHGVNRTGYLVCRYLIECHGFNPEEAIKLFGESRGHPIERKNYLDNLTSLKRNSSLGQPSNALGQAQSKFKTEERHPQHGQKWTRNSWEGHNRNQSQQNPSNYYHNDGRNHQFSRIQGQYRNTSQQQSNIGYLNKSRNYGHSRNQQSSNERYYSPRDSRPLNLYKPRAPPTQYPESRQTVLHNECYGASSAITHDYPTDFTLDEPHYGHRYQGSEQFNSRIRLPPSSQCQLRSYQSRYQ